MPNLMAAARARRLGADRDPARHPAVAGDLDQRRHRQDRRQARHHLVHGRSARRHPGAGAQPQPQGQGDLEHPRREPTPRPTVVGWWATYPAEDVGEGVDRLRRPRLPRLRLDRPRRRRPQQDLPGRALRRARRPGAGRAADLRRLRPALRPHLGRGRTAPRCSTRRAFPRSPNPFNPIHLFQQYAVTAQGYTAIAEDLLASRAYDLLHGLLRAGRQLLAPVHEVRRRRSSSGSTRRASSATATSSREWYRYQDELLGRLLAKIDLETTAVFVLSDHGFKSGERRIRSEETVDVKTRPPRPRDRRHLPRRRAPHPRAAPRSPAPRCSTSRRRCSTTWASRSAKDMDGKVLEQRLRPEFLDEHPIRYVADLRGRGDGRRRPARRRGLRRRGAAANEGALRALGYLGGSRRPSETGSRRGPPTARSPRPRSTTTWAASTCATASSTRPGRSSQQALELDPNERRGAAQPRPASSGPRVGSPRPSTWSSARSQVDPNSIGALSQLGEIRARPGRSRRGDPPLREALAIDDSQPFLYLGYGDVLQRAGRLRRGGERLPERARARPRLLQGALQPRRDLRQPGPGRGGDRHVPARPSSSSRMHPEAPGAQQPRRHPSGSRRASDGPGALREGGRERPAHLESRYNLALIYGQAGRMEEAIELLEQAAAFPQPRASTPAWAWPTSTSAAAKTPTGAFSWCDGCSQRTRARLGLAVLHAASGQAEKAKAFLAESLKRGGEAARAEAAGYPVLQDLLN